MAAEKEELESLSLEKRHDVKNEFHLTVVEVSFNILALAAFEKLLETSKFGDFCSFLVTADIVEVGEITGCSPLEYDKVNTAKLSMKQGSALRVDIT